MAGMYFCVLFMHLHCGLVLLFRVGEWSEEGRAKVELQCDRGSACEEDMIMSLKTPLVLFCDNEMFWVLGVVYVRGSKISR